MEDSVIEINDSIITINSDNSDVGVEDGEIEETKNDENLNIAAKLQSPPPSTNHQNSNAEISQLFEVTFQTKADYARLQDRLLEALSTAFADEQFVYTRNEAMWSICVQQSARTPVADNDLFLIDTAPASKLNAAQVPSYKRSHNEVLDEGTSARKKLKIEAAHKCIRPKAQSRCFNCGSVDHSLRECPRPRNLARIQRARKRNNRAERYHVDTEQRFAHIRPGRISNKTRHAMGFSRGELPFMFYRMRVLGYPPAWLEEAKVQSSGMALFNADGTEVQGPEEEDGESDSFKYDVNKIIDFPGFNADPGPKFYDDFQHHNVPRFQDHQLKVHFIRSLGENITKGYKRKKLIDLPTPQNESHTTLKNDANLVEHDMELDDDETKVGVASAATMTTTMAMQPPLPIELSLPSPLPPPPPPRIATPIRSPSPTLEDLKAQQARLLKQLESPGSTSSSEMNVYKTEDVALATPFTPTTPVIPTTPVAVNKPSIFKGPSIEGTPLLKFSVYDKLPVGENFKAGVSDVINFENLPDSTGKYEQMKDLLKNVRQKMNQLQNDDD